MKDSDTSRAGSLVERVTLVAPGALILLFSLFGLLQFTRSHLAERYPRLRMEQLAGRAEEVKHTMEAFLKAGLPLGQFVGFRALTQPLVEGELPAVTGIEVRDPDGNVVFLHRAASQGGMAPQKSLGEAGQVTGSDGGAGLLAMQGLAVYEIAIPLHNKFEEVGRLVLTLPKQRVSTAMDDLFDRFTLQLLITFALFTGFIYIKRVLFGNSNKWVLVLLYLATMIGSAGFIYRQVDGFFAAAAQANSRTVVRNLGVRLQRLIDMGLSFEHINGLDQLLGQVAAAHGEMAHLVLQDGDQTAVHVGAAADQALPSEGVFTVTLSGAGRRLLMVDGRGSHSRLADLGDMPQYVLLALVIAALALWLVDHFILLGYRTIRIPAMVVLSLSFVLLFGVGVGEAYRSYPKLQIEKLASQGESVKQVMEKVLYAGLPLGQFVGFNTLTHALLNSDPNISEIRVSDLQGHLVFANVRESANQNKPLRFEVHDGAAAVNQANAATAGGEAAFAFTEFKGHYIVTLPLNNKFEQVGEISLSLPIRVVDQAILPPFRDVALWLLGIIIAFAAFLKVGDRIMAAGVSVQMLRIGYGVAFLLAAAVVFYTLVDIYSIAIQNKTKALSISIGKRLEEATALGLPLRSFSGIAGTFADYKANNQELALVALVERGDVFIHTDESQEGAAWHKDDKNFEYETALAAPDALSAYQVAVGVPKRVVYSKLWRTVKNFFVLFVATAFLASLFLSLLVSLNMQRRVQEEDPETAVATAQSESEIYLTLIKILFFLVVFVEGLFASFLPQYLQQIAVANGFESSRASVLFTAYFAAFAASLIPSGNYADRYGVKLLMIVGVVFNVISVYSMTLVVDFYSMLLLRVMAGLGQGMVFIGVQSFILQVTSRGKTTKGTSVIVFGYNTGMISGTAIGALLVIYLGSERVFQLASVTGLFILCFILFLLPDIARESKPVGPKKRPMQALLQYFANLGVLFKDLDFIKTILLIGITTKATMTGVVVYALPLIMAHLAYAQDDIGQVLMFYAGGVLISNVFVPRIADRLGKTAVLLFWGALGSGVALVLMGLVTSQFVAGAVVLRSAVLVCGILLLGLAHGFIHAPIVTHIAYTHAAQVIGKSTSSSIYRFLERIGHVIGPLIVGHMLVLNQYDAKTLSYIGFCLMVFGLAFILLRGLLQPKEQKT